MNVSLYDLMDRSEADLINEPVVKTTSLRFGNILPVELISGLNVFHLFQRGYLVGTREFEVDHHRLHCRIVIDDVIDVHEFRILRFTEHNIDKVAYGRLLADLHRGGTGINLSVSFRL